MLGFGEVFGATLIGFLVPAFLGLLIISVSAQRLKPHYLAAFGVGLYLWFFSDTIGDASLLGVSQGLTGGVWHLSLWLAFTIGLVVLFSLDGGLFAEGQSGGSIGFWIPVLVAIAVGLHGFGEGAAIGGTAATTSNTNLLDAFGGTSGAASFTLHKALEPMMVGATYWIYARDHATDGNGRLKDIFVLTVLLALPGLSGSAVAYYLVQAYPSADFTYVFALGLGASLYAAIRLGRPLFRGLGSRAESIKMALLVLLGFTCLYLAALLHA